MFIRKKIPVAIMYSPAIKPTILKKEELTWHGLEISDESKALDM